MMHHMPYFKLLKYYIQKQCFVVLKTLFYSAGPISRYGLAFLFIISYMISHCSLLAVYSCYCVQSTFVLHIPQGTIMKIRPIQTCIMSSLPCYIFRCSVFRYVILVSFFLNNLLFNCNSFILVANKYLLTY